MRHLTSIVLLATVLIGQNQAFGAELLEIPGTGACEEMLKKVAAAFNQQQSQYQIKIPPSVGSGGGIKAVSEGSNLLGRVARPLSAQEERAGIRTISFARDVVLFAVGSKVNVDNLSTEQLLSIFSGQLVNWQELGATPGTIRLLTREPSDSTLTIINQHVKGFKDLVFSSRAKMLYHDYEMVNLLNKYKRSIGWLTGSSSKGQSFRAINLDQVEPNKENIISGRYPLVAEYSLVYKNKLPGGGLGSFVDFLMGEKGRTVMIEHGLVPLKR